MFTYACIGPACQKIHEPILDLTGSYAWGMEQTKRVAIYARISKDLTHKGLGVERQIADCKRYAADRGHEVVEVLIDNDISASGLKRRPSYLRLREMMTDRQVDLVLVYALDRLHRSMKELVEYIDLAEKTGIGIASITGGNINLASADGRLHAHMLGAFASAEREKTQERIKRKMRDLAEKGEWPGRRVYGFTAEGPEIVEEEAEVIREMAARILDGETLNFVASDFERRGIGTLQSTTWRASTVRTILYSARIAGHREHRGVITHRDAWPAIIDQETHYRLRARFAPGQGRGPKRGGPRKHLLTGLLRCGKCDGRMVFCLNGATRTPSYRCPKVQGNANCGALAIVAEPTVELLAEMLFEAHDRLAEAEPVDVDYAAWESKREQLAARKSQLAAAFGEGALEMAEWLVAKKVIETQMNALPAPPNTAGASSLRMTGTEAREAWPHFSEHQKRQAMERLWDRVIIHPRRIVTGEKIYDPSRVEPIWLS